MRKLSEKRSASRIFYLDILRALACIMVVMCHVCGLYNELPFGSRDYFFVTLYDIFARIAVPLFVMISGALMLDEDYECTPKRTVRHIIKMILFFAVWSAFYAVYGQVEKIILKHGTFSWHTALAAFLTGHYHLWFCFMIVGLYFIVPLLRVWVKTENLIEVEYFLAIAFIIAFLLPQIFSVGSNFFPFLSRGNQILGKVGLKYIGGYTVYFVSGWYFTHGKDFGKRLPLILGFAGFAVWYGLTCAVSLVKGQSVQLHEYLSATTWVCAAAVFLLIRARFLNKSAAGFFGWAVRLIAKHSLGIYAVHPLFLSLAMAVLHRQLPNCARVAVPILFCIIFALSLLLSLLLSKIPLLKKIVL